MGQVALSIIISLAATVCFRRDILNIPQSTLRWHDPGQGSLPGVLPPFCSCMDWPKFRRTLYNSSGWAEVSNALNNVRVVWGNLAVDRRGVFFECVIDKVTWLHPELSCSFFGLAQLILPLQLARLVDWSMCSLFDNLNLLRCFVGYMHSQNEIVATLDISNQETLCWTSTVLGIV